MAGTGERKLVGRDEELRTLVGQLADARRGHGSVLVIEGEAGSGKTSLLAEGIGSASGFAVFRGGGHEIDRDRPFGVIAEALAGSGNIADRMSGAIDEALDEPPRQRSEDPLRYRVVEDVVGTIEHEAATRPVLIALDDLHWADEPSLVVIHHLGRRISALPILLLLTRRPPRRLTGGSDPLGELLADPAVGKLDLKPLTDDEVSDLAADILGADPTPSLNALLGKAGGSPFFVTELLGALRDDRSISISGTTADVAATEVRPDLRMVILRRLGGLAAQTVTALRMASILGETFSARDLAVVLNVAPTELLEPLDEAVANGVLREQDDRLVFRHDLVRTALYEDVPVSMRNALHLQVARALAKSGAAQTQSAPHFALGADVGDDDAVTALRAAAAQVEWIDPKAARAWLSRALELVGPADHRRDDLEFELAGAEIQTGEGAAAEKLLRVALARAQPAERRVALTRQLAISLDLGDHCLEAAAVSDNESRAEDIGELEQTRFAAEAVEYRVHVEPLPAEADARVVLQRALESRDEEAIRRILAALFHIANWRADYHEALRLAEQYHEHAVASDPTAITGGMIGRPLAHLGRIEEALAVFRAEIAVLEERRDPRQMPLILTESAHGKRRLGQWDEAITDAEAAMNIASELGQVVRHDEAVAQLSILVTRRDDRARAGQLLSSMRSSRRFVAALGLALHLEASGDAAAALSTLRDAWQLTSSAGRDSYLVIYGADLVRLELLCGDRDRATAVAAKVHAIATTTGVDPAMVVSLRCRGLLAADPDTLLEAARLAEATGLPDDVAIVREEAAAALMSSGRATDATPLLSAALEYYEEAGAIRDQRRVEAVLRTLGVRRGRRGPRTRAQSGWPSLTDTELSVVDLAAEGLTNSEIGARLFISGRTVERHLTHIYSKLEVSSRVELAAARTARRSGG